MMIPDAEERRTDSSSDGNSNSRIPCFAEVANEDLDDTHDFASRRSGEEPQFRYELMVPVKNHGSLETRIPVSNVNDTGTALLRQKQIGRASCRERV